MSVDPRWEEIEALFDQALERPMEQRRSWLADQCGADTQLLDGVTRMLEGHDRIEGILDRELPVTGQPTTEPRLRLAVADRYEVERELGQGGMARVFLAHERKHARKVVLKVLKPDIARLY